MSNPATVSYVVPALGSCVTPRRAGYIKDEGDFLLTACILLITIKLKADIHIRYSHHILSYHIPTTHNALHPSHAPLPPPFPHHLPIQSISNSNLPLRPRHPPNPKRHTRLRLHKQRLPIRARRGRRRRVPAMQHLYCQRDDWAHWLAGRLPGHS